MAETGWLDRVVPRQDGPDKVSGRVRYAADQDPPGLLRAALVVSPLAHAEILSIDPGPALAAPGVRAVITGRDWPKRLGLYLADKPPLALGRVRYQGEPVAAVVADTELRARAAARLVKVDYRELEPVAGPLEALLPGAPLIHPALGSYAHGPDFRPEPGTNVANRTRIRKGEAMGALARAEVQVAGEFSLPPGDHAALEPRSATAEVRADGRVILRSSTQAPFGVRSILSRAFGLSPGKIEVIAPPLGGGFGGKAGLQLEALALLCSRAVGGRPVRLTNSREEDIGSSPGRMGLEAMIRLGADREGILSAAEIVLLFDTGAYADYSVNISRAAAISCSGPYRIPNLWCDSLSVYTNHPFATAFRGFGHAELTFALERAMDLLAREAGLDPLELRKRNALAPGGESPTGQVLDESFGDLPGCLERVSGMIGWSGPAREKIGPARYRAQGISSFWKSPAIPTNTDAGAILTFNEDGSCNLTAGVVSIGTGARTGLTQLVAQRLGLAPSQVSLAETVSTMTAPHDWATAASRSLFMAGLAALEAADDALVQIRAIAAQALGLEEDELTVDRGRVFSRDRPGEGLDLGRVVLGFVRPDGTTIGRQVIGRGGYLTRGLTGLDPSTGRGSPVLEWTLGAAALEVELDLADGSYRVTRAALCLDAGQVVNPALARAQAAGAVMMGLGLACFEGFSFDKRQRLRERSLRDLKVPRFGDQPELEVDFLRTPQRDGPCGARGLGEPPIVGLPAALANALSAAAGRPLNHLPLTPERVWRALCPEESEER